MLSSHLFKSNYCKLTFLLAFWGSYFLIPSRIFNTDYAILALLYMVTFAMSITCITQNIKERAVLAKTYQSSALGIFASTFGFAALQVCGLGIPACGSTVGVSIVALIFPGIVFSALKDYAVFFLIVSIVLQIGSLYFLKCFKKSRK